MGDWLCRTRLLLGEKGLERLQNSRVAVLGLGGVGGAAAESLCRAGVGHLLLVDKDSIDESNLNRQIMTTRHVIGVSKALAAQQRLLSICPTGDYEIAEQFFMPDNHSFLFDWNPDFVIDAIDTVTAKLHLVRECSRRGIGLITCLGTGNRLHPEQLRVGDLQETGQGCGCGLARVMRRELRRDGILHGAVVYSLEQPQKVVLPDSEHGRHAPGSISFVPPVAGYLLGAYAVNALLAHPAS